MFLAVVLLSVATQGPRPPQAPALASPVRSPPVSYASLRIQAIREGKPLVLYVNAYSDTVPGMLTMSTSAFEEVKVGIIVGVPFAGELHRRKALPAEATAEDIRAEVQAVRAALAPRQPRQSLRVSSRRDCQT